MPAAAALGTVIHVTSWLGKRGGGIPPVVFALAREAAVHGWSPRLLGLREPPDQPDFSPAPSLIVTRVPTLGPSAIGLAPRLKSLLLDHLGPKTVIHVHGLWMYPGIMAARLARRHRVPLLISPHGMLEPWALRNSRWRKQLVSYLYERKNLQSATCLHALCQPEAISFRAYGLRTPIAVLPNGVDPPSAGENASHNPGFMPDGLCNRPYLLFLSRLHVKKGLDNLLAGWARVQSQQASAANWLLVIAGPDEHGYAEHLKNLTRKLNIESRVLFTGALYGARKDQAYRNASGFILPSFSEGFSMAVLEAASHGLPILITADCNFPELIAAGGAIELRPGANGCAQGIATLLDATPQDRAALGARALSVVRRDYTWSSVGRKLVSTYDWLTGKISKPEWILVK